MKLETDCEAAVFVSSSGHCTLTCDYCIIDPVAKHQPSIDIEDLRFLLEQLGARKTFLTFSGVGDFFASYPRSARLLERILELPVEIGLDVNAVVIQEFPELGADKLEKIRYINLTMHYNQLRKNNLLERWAGNARTILAARSDVTWPDTIVSPLHEDEWEDAVAFYEREVFATTGKPVLLVPDVNRPLSTAQEESLQDLARRHEAAVAGIHAEDFAAGFKGREVVACPAGRSYFRVWNDGRAQGCPNLPHVEELRDNGNLKERRLVRRDGPYLCSTPRFCDCHIIDGVGLMGDVAPSRSLLARVLAGVRRRGPRSA